MKRFTHLEFDDSSRPPDPSGKGESVRDEGYFVNRAVLCFLHGDFELALRNYSRALEVNSSLFEGWAGQVRMLIELGEYPEALTWADKAMEMFPEHPELLAAKSVACLRDAKLEKAKAYSDNAISKSNAGPRVWLGRAELLLHGKKRIAQDCLSKALATAGEQSDLIRLEAGRLLRQYRHFAPACEYLEAAVRLFPKSPMAWYELGFCQQRLGFSQAVTSLEQCLHLHPHYLDANELLQAAQKAGFFRKLMVRLGLR
ncbi:MAG: tetratricopeptide repeat protein [Planctomycetaceae bacterium]|nr:tetratricopeptide repeat protein [Planctomycetaceae bacterium]